MVCVLCIVLAFRINAQMGVLILCGTVFVLLAALLIMQNAAPIFDKLQRFLDRMNILLMQNGNIIEQGSHAELLEKNGTYAELYNSQFA